MAPKTVAVPPESIFKKLGTYITIIVIFVYNNVLGKDLECACNKQKQTLYCWLYMVLPFSVLFVLKLWTDRTFQKIWRYACTCQCCNKFCRYICVLLYHIIKAAFIGSLWFVSLLVDGHWYVCCFNDKSKEYPHLACKNKNSMTAEEQEIFTRLKNKSWVFGVSILLCSLFVAAVTAGGLRRCCNKKVLYYKLILKEEEKALKDHLRSKATEKLTEKFCKNSDKNWKECFGAADKLIKEVVKAENQTQSAATRNTDEDLEMQVLST